MQALTHLTAKLPTPRTSRISSRSIISCQPPPCRVDTKLLLALIGLDYKPLQLKAPACPLLHHAWLPSTYSYHIFPHEGLSVMQPLRCVPQLLPQVPLDPESDHERDREPCHSPKPNSEPKAKPPPWYARPCACSTARRCSARPWYAP